MNTRMDKSRLNIGTYFLKPYANTKRHVRELADCGIDFVVGMQNDRQVLDLFSQYHIGAVLSGVLPGWWGGNEKTPPGTMAEHNPLNVCTEAVEGFTDHEAVWGIDCGDEPSALDFPHYGKIAELVEKKCPNQFAYLNIYPSYGAVAENDEAKAIFQLGTERYEDYLRQYCEYVPVDYISYDFYLYSSAVGEAYENLRVVSEVCHEYRKDMWIVLQVNSKNPNVFLSENQLRFQAFSAMAFGARVITWACYTAGWWHNQVLDSQGNKTEQYDKLKKVNREIKILGESYMKYCRTATHFVGFDPADEEMLAVNQQPVKTLDTGCFVDIHGEQGEKLVVGELVSPEAGGQALFICAADDPQDMSPKEFEILFKTDSLVKVMCGKGEKETILRNDGYLAVNVRSNEAVMVMER